MHQITPKIKRLALKFLGWLALTLIRTAIVLLAYALFALGRMSEYSLVAVAWVGRFVDVKIRTGIDDPEGDPDFAQKFTGDEIDQLAKTVKEGETIQEIEERLGVSYRQARKIKEASKNPLSINHYSWEDKLA